MSETTGVGAPRRNPVRAPRIVARIKEVIDADRSISNVAIREMVLKEFNLRASPGQISGALNREGIYRGTVVGGRPVICPEGTTEERRLLMLARGRERDYERERAARAARPTRAAKVVPIIKEKIAKRASGDAGLKKATLAAAIANSMQHDMVTLPDLGSGTILDDVEPSRVASDFGPRIAGMMGGMIGGRAGEMNRLSVAARSANPTYASPFSNLAHRPVQPSAPPRIFAPTRNCLWPIGDVGTPGFRFCDEVHSTGRSYCTTHCLVAYHGYRPRHDDVAA